jgi:hypothetical protein
MLDFPLYPCESPAHKPQSFTKRTASAASNSSSSGGGLPGLGSSSSGGHQDRVREVRVSGSSLVHSADYSATQSAGLQVRSRDASVKALQLAKLDSDKGMMWQMVCTAKQLAFDRSHPTGYVQGDPVLHKSKSKSQASGPEDSKVSAGLSNLVLMAAANSGSNGKRGSLLSPQKKEQLGAKVRKPTLSETLLMPTSYGF